jgi:rare lipoprotein A
VENYLRFVLMKAFIIVILIFELNYFKAQNDTLKLSPCTASFYSKKFEGRKCSNGKVFRNDSLTAAHKNLPFGTKVKVINLKNDSVVVVIITDRLPKKSKRCIDLSQRAAKQLNFLRNGLTKVRLEILKDSIN